jgi:hypothetical protein
MWVANAALSWFQISKESFDDLRKELASVRAERDLFKSELDKSQILSDWLRIKVNQLELERTSLLEKAYNIKIPAPELVRQPLADPSFNPKDFSFDDMGEDMARKMGFPAYTDK